VRHYQDIINDEPDDDEKDDTEWHTSGSELLGRRVKRSFAKDRRKETFMCGTVVGWLPADANDGLALWHVRHDDGDEEDLEEHEVTEAHALWESSEEKRLMEEKQASAAEEGPPSSSITINC
jgi:hypothetical protein